ncbi:MAG: cobalamin biosynthesis protein CobD, partial [Sneathiella sp.]
MSSMIFTSSSAFYTPAVIVLLAFVIDALVGDPKWFYRFVPHPVVLIGKPIAFADKLTHSSDASKMSSIANGANVTLLVVGLAVFVGYWVASICNQYPLGMILIALLASSLIAWRSLWDHVRDVAAGLDQSLEGGRAAVAHIVGRDPETLDESAISRAAIESLAENFSDGTVAPIFWFTSLGLPGLCGYKAVNTLDSMIGHRNERYEYFGKVAARLDDAVNYLPARLSGFLIVVAAYLSPGANGYRAFRAMLADASTHRSLNAGWPEAAMAGALDIALAGPRIYDG